MKEQLPITITEKFVAVSSLSITTKILYIIASIMIFVDGFITTPVALIFAHAYEANLWHNHWFNVFGIWYFFIITPITILMLYVFTRGLDVILYQYYYNNEKIKNRFRNMEFVTWVFLVLITLLFFSSVIRNIGVILNGI